MNQQGRSYNNSEEITAHMVGDFVAGAWDSFQMDNTSLRSSVPSISYANNDYLNKVVFGDEVNPLMANETMKNSLATSGFDPNRIHPRTKISKPHKGSDYVAIGDDKSVHVAGDGVVKEVRHQAQIKKDKDGKDVLTGWGNTVYVEHTYHKDENGNPIYRSRYSHLESLPEFKAGKVLVEGEVLGNMGASGGVSGPHLHYEVEKRNQQTGAWEKVDPAKVNVGKYEKLSEVPRQ